MAWGHTSKGARRRWDVVGWGESQTPDTLPALGCGCGGGREGASLGSGWARGAQYRVRVCRAFSPGKRFELPLESVNVRCRREGRKEVENAALKAGGRGHPTPSSLLLSLLLSGWWMGKLAAQCGLGLWEDCFLVSLLQSWVFKLDWALAELCWSRGRERYTYTHPPPQILLSFILVTCSGLCKISPLSLFPPVPYCWSPGCPVQGTKGALRDLQVRKTREEIIWSPIKRDPWWGPCKGNCRELCMGRWLGIVRWKTTQLWEAMQVWLISKIIHTFTRDLFRVSSKQNSL